LWAGELDPVWMPDEQAKVLRRRLGRREQLVRARSRAKNEIHAVLVRCLKGRPPFSDLFGVKGREWLAELELPVEEAETIESAMYERIRARRGNKIAVVACARKLAVLFWCLLSRGEDYAHQQPSLTAKKLRLLEIRAGAPTLKGTNTGLVSDWQAAAAKKTGASVTPGRA
jgi:hypothetical protein